MAESSVDRSHGRDRSSEVSGLLGPRFVQSDEARLDHDVMPFQVRRTRDSHVSGQGPWRGGPQGT